MVEETTQAVQEAADPNAKYQNLDPNQVLSVIPLLPYHEVADIGAGTGYFTVPLGKHLFDGKVYGIDDDQAALDGIQKQLDAIRLTNVTLGKVTRNKFPIEDDALDGALIAFYLNGAKQPVKVLEEAKRCLRRGGWLCVLEWVKRDEPIGPPVAQRMSVAELRSMLEEAGFRFTSRHDLNNRQYMLIMRK